MTNKPLRQKQLKILLFNLGYCTKLNGTMAGYVSHFYRYLFNPKKIEKKALKQLGEIMKREDPNLIGLLEIKSGKQIETLVSADYPFYDIGKKYGKKYGKKSLLNKLPVARKNRNAFISKNQIPFKKHYLKNGTKKLLYELKLPHEIHLFLMHFSLNKKTRQKQYREIQKFFPKNNRIIMAGDFNIFGELSELDGLMQKANLKLAHQDPTFPAYQPKRPLDLFLCSQNIEVKANVLNDQLSDHLPVILETRL